MVQKPEEPRLPALLNGACNQKVRRHEEGIDDMGVEDPERHGICGMGREDEVLFQHRNERVEQGSAINCLGPWIRGGKGEGAPLQASNLPDWYARKRCVNDLRWGL